MESSTIYRRQEEKEKNDRFVTVHTSANSGDSSRKNQSFNSFQHGDSGFTEEEEEYDEDDDDDDTKFVKSRMSGFSRRALEAHTMLFGMWIAGYWPVSVIWVSSEGLGWRSRRVLRQFLRGSREI